LYSRRSDDSDSSDRSNPSQGVVDLRPKKVKKLSIMIHLTLFYTRATEILNTGTK